MLIAFPSFIIRFDEHLKNVLLRKTENSPRQVLRLPPHNYGLVHVSCRKGDVSIAFLV